jgi:hypothetical protein
MTFSVDDASSTTQRKSADGARKRECSTGGALITAAAFGFSLDSATFLRLVAATTTAPTPPWTDE